MRRLRCTLLVCICLILSAWVGHLGGQVIGEAYVECYERRAEVKREQARRLRARLNESSDDDQIGPMETIAQLVSRM